MRIVFFGTSEFAVPALKLLAGSEWQPALVVTSPDAPAGRGLVLTPSPAKAAADLLGIPCIQPVSLMPISAGLETPADLFIVAAYGKILPPDLIALPKRGSLNIHPSLLPRWRGPSPIQSSILAGDADTGVTIMQMDEKIDHGPIVASSKFEIRGKKFAASELSEQLAERGARLLIETIPEWLAGRISAVPQDERLATYSKLLKRSDGLIDWSRPAEEIERMTRAFAPWPGAYTFWQKGRSPVRLVIEAASTQVSPPGIAVSPGTVTCRERELAIQTGNGELIVERIKPEGGRSLDWSEFVRGHRGIHGSQLVNNT